MNSEKPFPNTAASEAWYGQCCNTAASKARYEQWCNSSASSDKNSCWHSFAWKVFIFIAWKFEWKHSEWLSKQCERYLRKKMFPLSFAQNTSGRYQGDTAPWYVVIATQILAIDECPSCRYCPVSSNKLHREGSSPAYVAYWLVYCITAATEKVYVGILWRRYSR